MSSETMREVVADLRAGRIQSVGDYEVNIFSRDWLAAEHADHGDGLPPVVDCTPIYLDLVANPRTVALYQDHPSIAPPWTRALLAYENEHGNVVCMAMVAVDRRTDTVNGVTMDSLEAWTKMVNEWEAHDGPSQPNALWQTPRELDWDRVRWIIDLLVFTGGYGKVGGTSGQRFATMGPLALFRLAVYDDGEPADLHWMQLCAYPIDNWDMAHLVALECLNLLNCTNVGIVVDAPPTKRAERRRAERLGVRTSTIHVFPAGGRKRSATGQPVGGVALHSVRGSFAHYGACCSHHPPRGLLFGKYEGKVFRPQHALGSREHGEVHGDYVVEPERQTAKADS